MYEKKIFICRNVTETFTNHFKKCTIQSLDLIKFHKIQRIYPKFTKSFGNSKIV